MAQAHIGVHKIECKDDSKCLPVFRFLEMRLTFESERERQSCKAKKTKATTESTGFMMRKPSCFCDLLEIALVHCSPATLFSFFTERVRFLHRLKYFANQSCRCPPSVEEREGLNPLVGHGDGWPLVCNEME
jgi:hypothetical protein